MDSPNPCSSDGRRRLLAFVGGLDLTDGRWDTPGSYRHHLEFLKNYVFKSLKFPNRTRAFQNAAGRALRGLLPEERAQVRKLEKHISTPKKFEKYLKSFQHPTLPGPPPALARHPLPPGGTGSLRHFHQFLRTVEPAGNLHTKKIMETVMGCADIF